MVIVFGVGRSGTSWLGKIFDAHPDVVYRLEPDFLDRGPGIPFFPEPDDYAELREPARRYLRRLASQSSTRTNIHFPVFPKNYRRNTLRRLQTLIYKPLKALASVAGRPLPAPDFGARAARHTVIKSVSSNGRMALFAAAMPETRFIHLVRHPAGHAASRARGIRLGKMPPDIAVEALVELPEARRIGLTRERLAAASIEEKCALAWAVRTERPYRALRDNPNYRLFFYEQLCADPPGVAREMFDFAGIPWHPQVQDFVHASGSGDGQSYFGVYRDPAKAAAQWRSELDPALIEKITAMVAATDIVAEFRARGFWDWPAAK